jgi:hypothetical protein
MGIQVPSDIPSPISDSSAPRGRAMETCLAFVSVFPKRDARERLPSAAARDQHSS